MHIERIGRHLGAQISGVDLSQPLREAAFAAIRAAFFEHQVVVFRDQRLTPEAQIAFTRRFGELEEHVRKEHRLPDHPEILIVSNLRDAQGRAIGVEDAGRFWHSDLSYKRAPSLLSALYALEVPVKDDVVLGHTSFASATAAYEALPPHTRRRLEGLRNVHSYRFYRARNAAAQKAEQARGARVVQERAPSAEQWASVPDVEAPVVRTHPVTGARACS